VDELARVGNNGASYLIEAHHPTWTARVRNITNSVEVTTLGESHTTQTA